MVKNKAGMTCLDCCKVLHRTCAQPYLPWLHRIDIADRRGTVPKAAAWTQDPVLRKKLQGVLGVAVHEYKVASTRTV